MRLPSRRRDGDASPRRFSSLLYRLLLLRYPRRLRRAYGREMEADFLELLAERRRRAGLRGWVAAWTLAFAEALRPLPGPLAPTRRRRGVLPTLAVRLRGDVGAAIRALRRSPGFTALAVAVLGTAIALNASVFAVIQAYLLRPLPFPDSDRIVQVHPATAVVGWRGSSDVFEKAASWRLDGFTLVGDGGPEVVLGAWVSPDFFDILGVHPALGRTLGPEDTSASVAVISYALWLERFGGNRSVVGNTLSLYPSERGAATLRTFTIVGVLPRDFWYLNGYTDVLVPLPSDGPVYMGRLRANVPPGRAEEILTDRARGEGAQSPTSRIRVRPIREVYTATIHRRLTVLQVAALLVLLVACGNAGLLLLLRGEGRKLEMGIRRALGAGGSRLAVQIVSEALILALLAGFVGLVLAHGALSTLGSVVIARLGRSLPGGAAALHLDGWAVLATSATCAVGGIAFGSLPLWTALRRDPANLAGSAGRRGTAPRRTGRVRAVLVAGEVALSLTLLTGGALMVRSALHIERIRLGFRPAGLAAFTVGLTSRGSDDLVRRVGFFEALMRGISQRHGVASVALARAAPFDGHLVTREVESHEAPPPPGSLPEAVPQVVSQEYFRTMGMAAIRGRVFDDLDDAGGARVAVVSETLARRIWPMESAVGRRIRFSAWRMPEQTETPGRWLTVVGVVPDVVDGVEGARPTVYVPFRQAPLAWMVLVVRTGPRAVDLTKAVQSTLHGLDPDVPVYSHRTLTRAVAQARAPARFFAGLLGTFSGFALLLAVMGMYGVSAYAARLKRREVAVRMALGARRESVERLFVRRGMGVVAIGLAAGALGGQVLGRQLNGQLYGVSGNDAVTAVGVAALLVLASLLAAWIPARRAARADPSRILREE